MSLHLNSDSRAYSTQRAISGSQCLSGFCRESQRLSGFCSRSQPLSGFCQRVSICKHSARGDSVCQDSAQRASICQDSAREPVFVSIRLGETALRVKVFYQQARFYGSRIQQSAASLPSSLSLYLTRHTFVVQHFHSTPCFPSPTQQQPNSNTRPFARRYFLMFQVLI